MLPNVLLLLAISTGIYVTEPALRSVRPRVEGEKKEVDQSESIVVARLWEDPIGVLPTKKDVEKREKLSKLIEDEKPGFLLFVAMPGGGDPGVSEKRIRTRVAVMSAISGKCGFQPTLEGRVKVGWLENLNSEEVSVAYESYKPTNAYASVPWKTKYDNSTVGVVYFDTGATGFAGLDGLVRVIRRSEDDCRYADRISWEEGGLFPGSESKEKLGRRDRAAIGLNSSGELREFLSGMPDDPSLADGFRALIGAGDQALVIYSPRATISNHCLQKELRKDTKWNTFRALDLEPSRTRGADKEVNEFRFVSKNRERITLRRVGPSDMGASKALLYELGNRGIHIQPREECESGEECSKRTDDESKWKDGILLLSEMDTLYGRYLPISFRRARWDEKDRPARIDSTREKLIRVMHYPLALDGMRSTGSSGKDVEDATPAHVAEGPSQFDALRRLPMRIREMENKDRIRYRAIGLFGSDVHDKIMMLSALKPHFPNAVFFTTDLDARLWQGPGRKVSQNLLVASGFGLSLGNDLQGNVLPFRSNYQTATYASCLDALGFERSEEAALIRNPDNPSQLDRQLRVGDLLNNGTVRLYEIGRTGPVSLGMWDPRFEGTAGKGLIKSAEGRDGLVRLEGRSELGLGAFLLLCLLFVSWAGIFWRKQLGRKALTNYMDSQDRWIDQAAIWMTMILCLAGVLLTFRLKGVWGPLPLWEEPVDFNDAVSAWGLVFSNIGLALAAVWLLRTAMEKLGRNWLIVNKDYPFSWFSEKDGVGEREEEKAGEAEGLKKLDYPSALDVVGWLIWIRNWLFAGSGVFRALLFGVGVSQRVATAADRQRGRVSKRMGKEALRWALGRAYGRDVFCGGLPNRWIRAFIILIVVSVLFTILNPSSTTDAPVLVRGDLSRAWYGTTDILAQSVLIISAVFAADAQLLMLIALGKFRGFLLGHASVDSFEHDLEGPYPVLRRPEIESSLRACTLPVDTYQWIYPVSKSDDSPIEPASSRGLWELPLLRAAARRSQVTSELIYIPFTLLFLVILSRYPFFEGLSPTEVEKWLYGLVLLAPLILGGCVQVSMASVFRRAKRRIKDGKRRYQEQIGITRSGDENLFMQLFDRDLAELKELKEKTMYTLFGNPLFKAILLPISGAGILQMVQMATTLLK